MGMEFLTLVVAGIAGGAIVAWFAAFLTRRKRDRRRLKHLQNIADISQRLGLYDD